MRELADANDSLEQYKRRPNLRFEGIPEADHGEDTDAKVLDIANSLLGMKPPLELDDLERSHRLGRRVDKDGRPRTRAIIVRFQSERLRDEVYRARTKLKMHKESKYEHLHQRRFDASASEAVVRRPSLEACKEDCRLLDCVRESDGELLRQSRI